MKKILLSKQIIKLLVTALAISMLLPSCVAYRVETNIISEDVTSDQSQSETTQSPPDTTSKDDVIIGVIRPSLGADGGKDDVSSNEISSSDTTEEETTSTEESTESDTTEEETTSTEESTKSDTTKEETTSTEESTESDTTEEETTSTEESTESDTTEEETTSTEESTESDTTEEETTSTEEPAISDTTEEETSSPEDTEKVENGQPDVFVSYDVPLSVEQQMAVERIAAEYGIDEELVFGIMKVESKYNVNAVGKDGKYLGIMQVAVSNLGELSRKAGVTDLMDFEQCVTAACYFLRLYGKEADGNTTVTLFYYHGGYRYAKKMLNNGKTEDSYTRAVMKELNRIVEARKELALQMGVTLTGVFYE